MFRGMCRWPNREPRDSLPRFGPSEWKDPNSDWAILRFGTAWRPHAIRATLLNGADFEQATASDPHMAGSIIGVDDDWFGQDEIEVYIRSRSNCGKLRHCSPLEMRPKSSGKSSRRPAIRSFTGSKGTRPAAVSKNSTARTAGTTGPQPGDSLY